MNKEYPLKQLPKQTYITGYLISFETEYRSLVKRILQRHKERAKEKKEKEEKESKVQESKQINETE
jgi:hypothetical protein